MVNRNPEQELINEFVKHLNMHNDDQLKIEDLINSKCKSKKHADIEFISKQKIHWVIEAKSHESKDKYNTIHKIFGELLKETGRANRVNCQHAILIPAAAVDFYSKAFQCINRSKFIGFGKLIPIDTVFTSNSLGVRKLSWLELYDSHKPPKQNIVESGLSMDDSVVNALSYTDTISTYLS